MAISDSKLVQTLTAATLAYPKEHIFSCVQCLTFALASAGFEGVRLSDDYDLGLAVECDRDGQCHVIMLLALPAYLYEVTREDLEEFVYALAEEDDELCPLDGAVLDVASVCLDPVDGRCRIHHIQDMLGTGSVHRPGQHFFIPAGSDTPIPAEEMPMAMRVAPLALSRFVGA